MNSLKNVIVYLMFLSGLFISCQEKKSNKSITTQKGVIIDTAAVMTLEKPYNQDTTKKSLTILRDFLGLDRIGGRSTQEEIRIWFGYSLSYSGKLVIFHKKKNKWSSFIYTFKYNIDHNYDITSIQKKVTEGSPKSGWSAFLKELDVLGIYKLKNFDKISKYALCTDGDQLTIEIFKNNSYNKYEYPCYRLYMDEIPLENMKKIKLMCLFIQKEFGYDLFSQPK